MSIYNTQYRIQNQNMRNYNYIGVSLCLYLIVAQLSVVCFEFASLVVNADSKIINAVTTYQFDFNRMQDSNFQTTPYNTVLIQPSDKLIINFPSTYTLTTVTCIISIDYGSQFSPSCTVSADKVIVSNIVSTATGIGFVSVWVSNIQNPSPAITTDYFTGSIGSDTSASGYFASSIVLQPGTFASCYSTFSPSTVNSTGDLILTLTPSNSIGSTGYIVISFPITRRWVNDISSTNFMPISSSMSCSSRSANVLTSIQCSGDNLAAKVTAINLFNAPISSAFSYSINSFLSPPTNQQSDVLVATSYAASGDRIDTCNFYVSDLTPKAINSIVITSASGGAMTVNQFYTIRFVFTLTDTLSQTDTLTLVFPTGSVVNFLQPVTSNFTSSTLVSSFEPATLTLYVSIQNSNYNFSRNTILYLSVGSYQAPPSIEPTLDFKLTAYRNNQKKLEGFARFSAVASTLSGAVSSVGSTTINMNTSYTFQITLIDALSSNGKLKIILPSSVTITASQPSCASVTGSNVATVPVCSYNSTQNSITLTSMNSSLANIGAQTLTIVIAGLRNPSSATSTGLFTARSYYRSTDASLVASGTITGIVATAALIDNSLVSVSASSLIVNDVSVAYSLQYKVAYPIQSGGYLTMLVPQQIGVDLTSVSGACSVNINATSFVSTPCSATSIASSGTLFNFSNPLSLDATLNTVILLRVSAVFTNPQSTRPTSTFILRTYSPSGAEVAYINSAITIQMITPASFDTMAISRASNKNNDITVYSFSLTQKSVYEALSVIGIDFPSNVVPSTNSTCTMIAPASTALTCTYSGSSMKIILPNSTIASGAMVRISISNILNPASFQPTGPFTFTSKTVGELFSYSSSLSSPALTNSIPTNFQSLTYTFTPTIYGQPTSLQINFNPTDSALAPAKLRLSLANSFIPQTLSCNSFIDFVGTCSIQANSTIQVTGNFSNAAMAFSVTGFTSPLSAPTDYSSAVTLDSGGYKLDQSLSTIIFATSCTMPCRTCSSPSTPTSCTACYTNPNISTSIYLDSAANRCYVSCPNGKFANIGTLICNPCDTNCLTCVGNATFCLTCDGNSTYKYLYANNGGTVPTQICVSACPSTMFADSANNFQCTNCVSPCATCTSAVDCLSCVPGRYFVNGSCVTSCPVDVYVPNSVTNACDACSTTCRTCSIMTTNCTSCVLPLLFYQFQCRVSCPTPLVPQNGTCGPCDSNCLTCVNDPFNCTSCNTNSSFAYLLNYRCLANCPDTYYNNIALGACSLCSSVASLNCIHCSSASACVSCNTGYVLMGQSCLNYTPAGYVNISGVAQPCIGDCLTCSVSTSNCTSCINNSILGNICYPTCPPGYLGINHVCQPCTSPCATCSGSLTTCLSCLTLTSRVYLSNSRCVALCPDGTYASNANNTCVMCSSPCEYCLSAVSCLTCLNGFYLFNQTCNTVCPTGYAGVSRVCQPCLGNCATCQNQTTLCTTCLSGTYLYQLNSSCVSSCGNGLYVDIPTQTCVYCSAPCKTCTNTATTCLSCLTGALYNFGCLPVCPTQYFNLSGVCQQCPQSCAICTSLTNCNQCTGGYLLYNGYCVTNCPATNAVVSGGTCTLCSGANCHECTSADVCTMCDSQYSLLNGACLSACPASYNSNGTHCVDINQQVLTTPNSFPVPFSIAAAVIVVACLMSKLQFNKTFLPGAVFAFLGLLQVGALAFFLYLYYANRFTAEPFPFFIGVAAIAYMMLLNFLALVIQNIIFCMDRQFSTWCMYTPNKCALFWINLLSVLVCHKFRNILFCKLFSFTVFSAQLQNISKFKVLNIFSFLSLIHSGAAIFAVAVSVGSTEKQSQIFYQCIDVIVITSLNVLLAFFNVMKGNDFFFEMTPEGYELKKRIKAEEDYYSQKIDPVGQEIEDEEKIYPQSVYQVYRGNDLHSGLMSTQAFKPKLYPISQYKDSSFGSLVQPEYQDISVQAVPIIDNTFDDRNVFDLTQINKPDLQEQHSNYTTIFNKSSKGVQNTIDHGPSLRSQGVQMTEQSEPEPIEKHDVSIQPSNRKMVDQSVQRYDHDYEPVDRSVQRTVFFRQDQSIQYAESMKSKPPSMKDMSVSAKRVSFKDQSIQQIKSNTNKSIMYQPQMKDQQNQKTISRENQSIQIKPSQQSFAAQAVEQQSEKGNQKTISVNEKSAQIDQSVQDKAIQHQNLVQFDQFQEDINPTKTSDQVIFEQEPNQVQQQTQKNQLVESQQDEFLLPKQQITSYQQELEQRIRQKQKELSQIKRKIEMQERKNIDKSSKLSKTPTFVDNSNKIGGLQVKSNIGTLVESNDSQSLNITNNNAALKKENKQVEQQVAEIDKTIEQIEVINDQNQAQPYSQQQQESSLKQLKEKDVSKFTEEEVIGMLDLNLQEHPQKIIFDNSSQQEQHQNQQNDEDLSSNKIALSNKKQSEASNHNKKPLLVQYGESEAEISSGKDWSTKIYSSSRQTNNLKPNKFQQQQLSNNQINEPQNSVDNLDDPIIEAPIHPYAPHSFSDMSQTIQEVHPNSNLNLTGETTYLKHDEVKSRIQAVIPANVSRVRKQVPSEQDQHGLRRKFQTNSNTSVRPVNKIDSKNEERNTVARKSSLIFAGKTQLIDEGLAKKQINRDSPLKAVKRWEYDQDSRNIEQSGGEQQIVNTRAVRNAHLIAPLQTDKQVFDFKTSRVQASNIVKINRQPVDQISPYIGEVSASVLPNKPSVYQNNILSDFGNEEQPEIEPYIQQQYESHEESSHDGHRNNLILAQMLHRPVRSELEQYYNNNNKKPRRSREKERSRDRDKDWSGGNNMSFNSDSFNQTQKIYQQRLGQQKRR